MGVGINLTEAMPQDDSHSDVMSVHDRVVNGLWIGDSLSLLELLTVRSFVAHGHQFHLWTYDTLDNELPHGVELKDANRIIPQEQVFSYRRTNQFGHGKGSVSGFSDIFRYKLLHDEGGWWVDMDVTCLSPLSCAGDYLFRPHHELTLVGNVMKCPKGSELMLNCFNRASAEVTEDNTDWHLPITILVEGVRGAGLTGHVTPGLSIDDRWDQVRPHLLGRTPIPAQFKFIHWMNEEWRRRGLDKYDFRIDSAYGELLMQHGLVQDDFTTFGRAKNNLRFTLKQLLDP
jgi:hypothetical protein